jgi:catechol 2,3-dioxygenase-like lactoylglutathione lyase family enzyme
MTDSLINCQSFQDFSCNAESQHHLGVHSVDVRVRDQEKSLQFYVETLGFSLLIDARIDDETRCIAVQPPSYSAILSLVRARSDSDASFKIGGPTGITLVTDDIAARFEKWSARGVLFKQTPVPAPWGVHAVFEDIDGNQFSLLQSPWLIDMLTAQRRAAEERKQAEARAAHEIELAKRAQAQLFPQARPPLQTLEYAGTCLQASGVGGDYYDFVDLGPGRLALAVGDIAGKGIAGALLMANLQAHLRNWRALGLDGLEGLLESINRSLHESTTSECYATLFVAQYEDKTRRLHYVNCGHPPPLLLRQDGTIERLDSSATVLGMFSGWSCASADVALIAGDTVLFYTDGVTEALNRDGCEFGEDGVIEVLRAGQDLPVEQLVRETLEKVGTFTCGKQDDDITVVATRCR